VEPSRTGTVKGDWSLISVKSRVSPSRLALSSRLRICDAEARMAAVIVESGAIPPARGNLVDVDSHALSHAKEHGETIGT
jgi:hypothetical protein